MKKFFLLGLFFIFLILPGNVNAHMVGQPPFFKINGEYSDLYPVPISSSVNFDLPQDLAKKSHVVGEPLQMEMDLNQLPILPEVIDQTTFFWEFGDGVRAEGFKNTHTYPKAGSYFMHVMAKYRTDEPQLIQSTLINVLPDTNYKLPEAKLKVNGQASQDPLTDIIDVDFNQPISFDSSDSTSIDGIAEYLWDFGDGQTSTEANPTHKYDNESVQVFPVLRIKDKNGFIHDSYVQLEQSESTKKLSFISGAGFNWPLFLIGVIVMLGFGGLWFLRKRIIK